ncbi:hypothetical protein BH23CHL5_BH23CHL5_10830 [soil metagenome]
MTTQTASEDLETGLDLRGLPDANKLPGSNGETMHEDDDAGRIGYGRYARYSPALLGLVIVFVVSIIGWREWKPAESDVRPGQLVDEPAPAFSLPLISGNRIELNDLAGQAIVLNFWASWCAPCRVEMPALQAASDRFASENTPAVVVGVGIKNDYEPNAIDMLSELDIRYPVGRDTDGDDPVRGVIEAAYGVTIFPATVIIRPDGTVSAVRLGEISEDEIQRLVSAALS